MAIRTVLRMGHPLLRVPARPLTTAEIHSSTFQELVRDLIDTMHSEGGIGIAAPQIGVSEQVAIIEIAQDNERYLDNQPTPLQIVVNPKLTILDPTLQGFWEGCLSVPGLRGFVQRPRKIQLDYLDEKGIPQQKIVEDFLSTVYQHELDHLWGKLYIDSMKDLKLLSFQEEFIQFIQDQSDSPKLD